MLETGVVDAGDDQHQVGGDEPVEGQVRQQQHRGKAGDAEPANGDETPFELEGPGQVVGTIPEELQPFGEGLSREHHGVLWSPFQAARAAARSARIVRTRCATSRGLNGLVMYSSAPPSRPRSRSICWPLALSMIT